MSTTISPRRGKIGEALIFNGITNYIEADNVASSIGSGDVTFSAWINRPEGKEYMALRRWVVFRLSCEIVCQWRFR
jgi:hypothetical protein